MAPSQQAAPLPAAVLPEVADHLTAIVAIMQAHPCVASSFLGRRLWVALPPVVALSTVTDHPALLPCLSSLVDLLRPSLTPNALAACRASGSVAAVPTHVMLGRPILALASLSHSVWPHHTGHLKPILALGERPRAHPPAEPVVPQLAAALHWLPNLQASLSDLGQSLEAQMLSGLAHRLELAPVGGPDDPLLANHSVALETLLFMSGVLAQLVAHEKLRVHTESHEHMTASILINRVELTALVDAFTRRACTYRTCFPGPHVDLNVYDWRALQVGASESHCLSPWDACCRLVFGESTHEPLVGGRGQLYTAWLLLVFSALDAVAFSLSDAASTSQDLEHVIVDIRHRGALLADTLDTWFTPVGRRSLLCINNHLCSSVVRLHKVKHDIYSCLLWSA